MLRLAIPALAVLAATAPLARAADVRVVNERGLSQAALWTVDDQPPRYLTDPDGWIRGLTPGASVRVTRTTSTDPCHRNPGGTPEGAGVTLVVPEAGGVVTLPNATTDGRAPATEEAERWIVGQINARRAGQGKPPVRVSAILARAADAVASAQAAQQLSFPPPFCRVVVADWGFPGTAAFNIAGLDANGADPRRAWEHWSDGSVREQYGTLGNWNAVGIGDGRGAWAAYFANCPAGADARCEMTTDEGDAGIVLPPAQAGSGTPTRPTGPAGPGGGPAPPAALRSVTVPRRQRGRAVRVRLAVGQAGSAVVVRLHRGGKVVGRVLRRDVSGTVELAAPLSRGGRAALQAKRSLRLRVELVVDPPAGESMRTLRVVHLRR